LTYSDPTIRRVAISKRLYKSAFGRCNDSPFSMSPGGIKYLILYPQFLEKLFEDNPYRDRDSFL